MHQVNQFTQKDAKCVEQIVNRDEVQINHIVLPQGERLPEHYSNSNVHLIIVRGMLSITLEGEKHQFSAGNILSVPYHTKMDIRNEHAEVLEFFVVKAPHPEKYGKE